MGWPERVSGGADPLKWYKTLLTQSEAHTSPFGKTTSPLNWAAPVGSRPQSSWVYPVAKLLNGVVCATRHDVIAAVDKMGLAGARPLGINRGYVDVATSPWAIKRRPSG